MRVVVDSILSIVFFLVYFYVHGVESFIVHANQSRAAITPTELETYEDTEKCDFYPEIVLVQDISDSYSDPLLTMASLVPSLFTYLQERFESKVKVSLVSFVDKPVNLYHDNNSTYRPDYGFDTDFCAKVVMPLTAADQTGTQETLQQAYTALVSGGGLEWIEGASDALYRTAISDAVGWSAETTDSDGNPIVRIAVVATDAMSHLPEQFLDYPLTTNDLVDRPTDLATDINAECKTLDSPSATQMKSALTKRGIIPVFLAARPTYTTTDGDEFTWPAIEEFSEKMNRPEFNRVDTGLVNYYTWFLSEYVGVDGVIQYMNRESTSFVSVFDSIIADVTDYYCSETTTTTTLAPDATTATTAAAATTTTTTTTDSGTSAGVILAAAGAGVVGLVAAGLLGARRFGNVFTFHSTTNIIEVAEPEPAYNVTVVTTDY